jgi:hypothetical protein
VFCARHGPADLFAKICIIVTFRLVNEMTFTHLLGVNKNHTNLMGRHLVIISSSIGLSDTLILTETAECPNIVVDDDEMYCRRRLFF